MKMIPGRQSLFVLGLAIAFASGPGSVNAEDVPIDLVGKWRVETVAGAAADPDVKTWLEFENAGTVGGSGGCNSVFGPLRLDGGGLKIGPLAVTRKACPPKVMGQERDFLKAIPTVRQYSLRFENQVLILMNGSGDEVVVLAADE
jgi:heat shock protein HslJ